MRATILTVATVFFFAFASPLWSVTLWDKAIQHFSSKTDLPVNVVIDEKFISPQGRLEHTSTLEATLFRDRDNSIHFVPHTGYANGEEIPKDELRQMSEVLPKKDLDAHLFKADPQTHWRQENEVRDITGHSCRRFSFSTEISGHKAEGTAWLTADKGLPLEAELHFTDVPFQQDETTINTYTQKDTYQISASGQSNVHSSEISIALRYTLFYVPYEGQLQRNATFANYRQRQDLPLHVLADDALLPTMTLNPRDHRGTATAHTAR